VYNGSTVNERGNDMSFEEFMKKCDATVSNRLGLGVYDLEDWAWMDAYEDEFTPTEAVNQFLEDIGANF